MTNEEILAAFVRPEAFPEEAVAAADARREEIAPLLIAEIESWAKEWRADIDGYYYLVNIAFQLLAEWRDQRAFKPVLALLASPSSEILGDTITEEAPSLLARIYDGDVEALKALVLNSSADEFVRDAVLEAYTILVLDGVISREDALAFLLHVFESLPHETDYVWPSWALAVSELLFDDLAPKVKQLCEEGAIDKTWMNYGDFESDLKASRNGVSRSRRRWNRSPIESMQRWHYVEPGEEVEARDSVTGDLVDAEIVRYFDRNDPAVNRYKDVGRNDPCPCGSGKKFKKCCLPKVEAGLI